MTASDPPRASASPLWVNHLHLYHFYVVAQEGGFTKAAAALRVSHSTLSAQVAELGRSLGGPLCERAGRGTVLTPFGQEVFHRAGELFRLGNELATLAQRGPLGGRTSLRVGLVPSLPRTVAWQLLAPALEDAPPSRLTVTSAPVAELLDQLASGRLHLALSHHLPPHGSSLRFHATRLGETSLVLYATRALCARWRDRFPDDLAGAPLLLPDPSDPLRAQLDRWFAERGQEVEVVGEFDDAATMRAAGLHGAGLFPVREAIAAEVDSLPEVERLGPLDGIREAYFALTVERRVRHPGVQAVLSQGPRQFQAAGVYVPVKHRRAPAR